MSEHNHLLSVQQPMRQPTRQQRRWRPRTLSETAQKVCPVVWSSTVFVSALATLYMVCVILVASANFSQLHALAGRVDSFLTEFEPVLRTLQCLILQPPPSNCQPAP